MNLPAELTDLAELLTQSGYSVAGYRRDDRFFGDEVLVFAGRQSRVRFIQDRGQWFIDIATTNGDWYSAVIWLAHLRGEMPPLAVRDLAEDAAFVAEHVRDFESDPGLSDPSVEESLLDWRWRRAAARREMPPEQA